MRTIALVIIVVVVLGGCRDVEPVKSGSNVPAASATEPAGRSRPVLAPIAPGIDPVGVAIDDTFREEPRDPAWADPIEREIVKLVPDAFDVTCRRLQCRLTVMIDTADDLPAKAEALQSKSSLGKIARSVELAIPNPRPDGGLTVRVYVRFERPGSTDPNLED